MRLVKFTLTERGYWFLLCQPKLLIFAGVGQIVVHVAGTSRCKKAVGIECADVPAKYAKVALFISMGVILRCTLHNEHHRIVNN